MNAMRGVLAQGTLSASLYFGTISASLYACSFGTIKAHIMPCIPKERPRKPMLGVLAQGTGCCKPKFEV